MLTNARSIMNKLAELQNYIDQCRPLIIGITETWCTNSFSDAELHLEDYNSFRCDRIHGRAGGVLLYVHSSLHATTSDPLKWLHIEDSVWCIITRSGSAKMLVGVVYRSPQSSDENDKALNTAISNIDNYHDCSELLIMGDFNVPNIDWIDLTCSNSDRSFAHQFIDASLDSYLT